jgi:hypothetical protein
VLWRSTRHGVKSGQGGPRVLEMYLKGGGVCVCAEEGGMPDCPELKIRAPKKSLPLTLVSKGKKKGQSYYALTLPVVLLFLV